MVKQLNLMAAFPKTQTQDSVFTWWLGNHTVTLLAGDQISFCDFHVHCIHTIPRNTCRHITHTKNKINTS